MTTARAPRGAKDASLVEAACRGDAAALAAIWTRYHPVVRQRLSTHLAGSDIDDSAQDVFLRCFAALPRLRDPGALRSFIIGIAIRTAAIECRRRRLRRWTTLTDTGELPETGVSHDMEAEQFAGRMRASIRRLMPESFEVLELRFVRGHELTDVARAMGISLATAKRHLSRASARLRAIARTEGLVDDDLPPGDRNVPHELNRDAGR